MKHDILTLHLLHMANSDIKTSILRYETWKNQNQNEFSRPPVP